jgi:hypothetical protein
MINGVTQAAARYANSDAAQAGFHQLESSLQACNSLHDPNYVFTLDKPDPSTLRISADQWSHLYRTKSAVLVSVGVVGLNRRIRFRTRSCRSSPVASVSASAERGPGFDDHPRDRNRSGQ